MTAFAKGFADSGCGRDKSKDSSKSKSVRSVSVQVDSVIGLHLTEGVYEIKRMETRGRSRLRSVILFCLLLAVAGIVGFGYFCNDQVSELHCISSGNRS